MMQAKTNDAELLANIKLKRQKGKKYILFTSWLISEKCPMWNGPETNFFVAIQIHICYYLSVSRLPLKVREDCCSLLNKMSKVCTLGKIFIR